MDGRYSIRREFCGHPTARFVVRFCETWVGCRVNRANAMRLMRRHEAKRNAILCGR